LRGRLALGTALALTGLVSACEATSGVSTSPVDIPPGLSTATVTWIEDGDTVMVDDEGSETTVRLIGVNAPEKDECFYQESTSHLIDTLEGSTVGVDDLGLDQFGRTLAYLWAGNTLVNLDLVAGGWAIATTPGDTESHGSEILQAESQAVEASAGLWAADACGPREEIPEMIISVISDPSGPDEKRLKAESVSLVNSGPGPIDLSGWMLRDESSVNRYRFSPGTMIEPQQTIEVPSSDPAWEPGDRPVWNNDGDTVLLLTARGTVVARLRYAG
jgi:micrococcal nuclease